MALPIPTDGQQVLRQLVKDVAYLKRTGGASRVGDTTTGVPQETIYPSEPNGPDGETTYEDVPLDPSVVAPGQIVNDGETVLGPKDFWVVVPSAPVCSTNQQAVTVTWDGYGAGGEDVPPNFGVLEIHRSLDEFFEAYSDEEVTLVGVMTYPGSIVFTNQMYDVNYYYRFIMRSADGRRSGQSAATLGVAALIVTGDMDPGIFNEINDTIDAMNDSIAEAQDTADNAIASYAPEYAVSASQTVPPTTGWSTATPVRTPGTYIWYRTSVTYGNGATSTTNPALLTGNDGAPGAPGTPAPDITLTSTTQILAAPAAGGATTPATAVVTGVATNTTITAWLYSADGAAFSVTVPTGVSRTGNVVTITGSTMTAKTIAVRMTDAGTTSDTLTVAKVTEGVGTPGAPGTPGADGMTILLSNEAQTFAAGTTNAQAGTATTTVIAYKGAVQQTATVGTITGGATGITAAVTSNGTVAPLITFTVTTALATANGTFTIPVTSGGITVNQIFTWSLAFSGAAGAPGTPAAVVSLNATTQVLTSPAGGGATSPATSVVTGTTANTTITVWEYSVDGAAFSATVPAGTSRTANVVTITGSTMTAKTLTVRMADAAGVADTMTVAKVSDGAGGTPGTPGTPGADAYTVLLSNESQTFAAGTTNAQATTATSTVMAYKGAVAQTATVGTITGGATGISAAVTNNGTTAPLITFTVTTALVAANGTFTIPVTVAGITFTQVFTWSLSFTGAQGTPGAAASVIDLVATTQVLASPSGGGATTPATSVITGTAVNTTISGWTYSVDGAAFTGTPPTGVGLAGNVVTITGATMTAKTIAVRATGVSGVTDTMTVAKVTDGAGGTPGTPGTPGADGLTVLLSNEAATIAAGVTNALATTVTSTVIAYKGTAQQSATVGTITGGATGITAAVTNNGSTAPLITFTVTTALVAANGSFTIPVTVAGVTVNQVFSWSLSFAGPAGAPGTPASIVDLVTTTQVLTSPAAGGATTPATAVLTGSATNTTIATWSYSVDGGTFTGTPPTGLVLAGNVVTITGGTMTAKTIAVRATGASGVTDTITVAKNYDGATGGTGTPGTPGAPGADAYTVLLSNEAQTFAAGTTNALAGSATSTVIAYKGTVAQTSTVGTITGGATGITAAVTNNGTTAPLITFTVTTALATANGTFNIPVTVGGLTFTQVFSWSLSFSGAAGSAGTPGTPGAPASVVDLVATTQTLTSPATGGATTPATAVITGSATNTTISGWTYSVDGGTFTGTPPTGAVLAGNVVTITGSTMTAKTIAVRATGASGVTDTMTVAKVSDGAAGGAGAPGGAGPAGADAYTVLLTNEAQVFPGTVAAAIAGSATTSVIAYKATTAQTATIGTITGQVTGLTTAITNNGTTSPLVTVTVTTSLTTGGTLTIPITVGGIVFTKLFSWSVSFAGATGGTGGTGATGVSVTSLTPYFATVTPIGAAAPAIPVVSPPVAPWVATEPTYVANTELYRTERVLYSNATFQYTAVTKVSSYAAATAAMTSANGKNRVIYSTADASGTSFNGVPLIDGDTWYKYQTATTPQTVVAQWRFLTNAWVSQKVDGANLAYLDAGTITAGYLDVANRINAGTIHASKIQSNTIRAQQLVLADTSNMAEINESYAVGAIDTSTHTIVGGWSTRTANTSGTFAFRDKQGPVPLKAGDRVRVVFEAYADAPVTATVRIATYPGPVIDDFTDPLPITTTPTTFSTERTLTADYTNKQTYWIALLGVAGRNVFLRNVRAYTMNAGELIVDGTVTTRHLAANSVTAGKIDAGAITAEKIALGVLRRNLIFDGSFEETYPLTDWDGTAAGQGNTAQWRRALPGSTAGLTPVRNTGGMRTRSGNNAMSLTCAAGQVNTTLSGTFPVTPGTEYRLVVNACSLESVATLAVSVLAGASVSGIDGSSTIAVTEDSSWVTSPPMGTEPLDASEFFTYSWSFIPAAGQTFAALRVRNNAPPAQSTLVLDDISVVQTGIGGASELTAAGLRLFNNDGMEVTALVSNRSNYLSVSGVGGETLASINASGGASFQSIDVRGASLLIPVSAYSTNANVATLYTTRPHGFEVDDAIWVNGVDTYVNGGDTVLAVIDPTTFTFSITSALTVPYTLAPEGASVNLGAAINSGDTLRGLTIYGADFNDHIWELPWGVKAWTQQDGADFNAVTSGNEIGLFELGYDMVEGRQYEFNCSPILLTITGATSTGVAGMRLRGTTTGATPDLASTVMHYSYGNASVNGNSVTMTGNKIVNGAAGQTFLRVLVCLFASGCTADAYTGQSITATIKDVGPIIPQSGTLRNLISGTPAAPVLKTYTTTWTSTTACSYMGSGAKDSSQGEQDMKQGYSSYDGDSESIWIFPNTITTTLAGVTSDANITKVRIYLYANHWYNSAGGTGLIKRHGYTAVPTTNPTQTTVVSSAGWPKPGGRWVDITNASGVKAALRNGTFKGIGVGPSGGSNLTYYGRFNKSGAKIEVTYKK